MEELCRKYLTIQLLEVVNFGHLTSLELHHKGHYSFRRKHEWTQELIKLIHNAPSLMKLVLVRPEVKIADLENLHASATKLKHLEFTDVGMFASDGAEQNQPL